MNVFAFALLVSTMSFGKVDAEMEGMEYEIRGDGTFLTAGPTFAFDRVLGSGGTFAESELWTPAKLRNRLLFNRMSGLPSWTPFEPSVWLKTGNELGDMIYNDFITEENRPENRTPILEAGFTTPSFNGFWATARLFQDDHFSSGAYDYRRGVVNDSYAFFGENWPFFSTAYGGFGFTHSAVNASVLVGEEYLWLYTASSRWIPVHYKPRVEARTDVKNLSVTLAYEDAEFMNARKKETGKRKELNGSAKYSCGELCKQGVFQFAAGFSFRAVEDSGTVYTELEEDRVLWPFVELRVQPLRRLTADVMFGMNERDWMVQDSIQYVAPVPQNMGVTLGVKNISATRMNPLADTKEFYGDQTIDLTVDGQMTLLQSYMTFVDTMGNVDVGGKLTYWAEYGAETFDVDHYEKGSLQTRYGDASRVNSWINGVTGEIWIDAWYGDLFKLNAMAGLERLNGKVHQLEVTPAEFFVSFEGDWLINNSFRISHALKYRSDAEWNLRTYDHLIVKGDWYWDVTFEQRFPKQGLSLAGTLLHVLADDAIEVPNGGYDRLRFICTAKKSF
ncbi:MAG: hypothetical protein HUK20_07940 [Fibrobacter sp.]|nr:hypothetical protein [Fibrobacter sp.]